MKKLLMIILTILVSLSFSACEEKEVEAVSKVFVPEYALSRTNYNDSNTKIFMSALNNDTFQISSVQHLPIFKCEKIEELNGFCSDFSGDTSVAFTGIPSFNEVVTRYDKEYFKKGALLIVYIPSNSGSYRYGIENMFIDKENAVVHVKRLNNPEAITMDMTGWLIAVEVKKDDIKSCTMFDADLV